MELSSSIAISERMNGNEFYMEHNSKFERMQLMSIPDVERNSAKNKLTPKLLLLSSTLLK